jgi:hypothetical protein
LREHCTEKAMACFLIINVIIIWVLFLQGVETFNLMLETNATLFSVAK